MRRRRKLLVTIGGVVVAAIAAAAIAVAVIGEITYYDPPAQGSEAAAPAWAAPCFRREPRRDRELIHFCARGRGRVVYVRTRQKPPPRPPEVHFAMIAAGRVWIVKLPENRPSGIPSIGSTVTVIGPVVQSRYRLREIQAWRIFD
jgi:hypothetical protein